MHILFVTYFSLFVFHSQIDVVGPLLLNASQLLVLIIIIISGFGIYGAAIVPDSGVGNTWQRLTLVLHELLSNGLTPFRLHIVISFLTHADHVFLGLPRSLVPGSPKRVMELMHEVARSTCPYHLRRRVRRTAVISSRSSFWEAQPRKSLFQLCTADPPDHGAVISAKPL